MSTYILNSEGFFFNFFFNFSFRYSKACSLKPSFKHPASWRHWISRPMRIVAPIPNRTEMDILTWTFFFKIFLGVTIFFCLLKSNFYYIFFFYNVFLVWQKWVERLRDFQGKSPSLSFKELRGSDRLHTYQTRTDIETYRLNPPSGPIQWEYIKPIGF